MSNRRQLPCSGLKVIRPLRITFSTARTVVECRGHVDGASHLERINENYCAIKISGLRRFRLPMKREYDSSPSELVVSTPQPTSPSVDDDIPITSFRGMHSFLSNQYHCSIMYDGRLFSSAEAAFQSEKTNDQELKDKFAFLSPLQAIRLGSKIYVRDDWENVMNDVMYGILLAKFRQNIALRLQLLATSPCTLVNGNIARDDYWGVILGRDGYWHGHNMLGQILMKIRTDMEHEIRPTMDDNQAPPIVRPIPYRAVH